MDYKIRRLTKDRLYSRILDAFLMAERRVEIASITVHLVEAPEFRVRVRGPDD